jgi:glycosyltransferase involved in cell wall biosynthesis
MKESMHRDTPFVSVVIDSYNYGHYVEQAIESALGQDFPHAQFEILVVDDGSTDDTAERLQKYGDAIRYLRKPNGGQASAFNFGFAAARGEIIALLDADDLWLPGKLRRICETFESNPDAGMVYHRTQLWRGGENLEEDSYFVDLSGRVPESRVSLLRYPMVGTSCLAFRRKALEKLLPVPEALRSQADAYLTGLVIFVAPVAALPEFLAKYRLHGANLFQQNAAGTARGVIENRIAIRAALLAEIRAWLQRKGHDLASPNLRDYLKQWTKSQELDSFDLQKPGRWKYFRYLVELPRIYGQIMSTRHRLYSYLRAACALVLGYDHLYLFENFRKGYKNLLRGSLGGALPADERKEAATHG